MFSNLQLQRLILSGRSTTIWKKNVVEILLINSRCLTSESGDKDEKRRLFKLAHSTKKIRTYDEDKIDKMRAMAEYGLKETDFADLHVYPRNVTKSPVLERHSFSHLYSVVDVRHKAMQIHGSIEAIDAHRRPLVAGKSPSDAERMRMRMRVESTETTKGANKVVFWAFCCNLCDCTMKFAASYLTGSKSLFAEGVHSLMDTCNQLILMYGNNVSAKIADNLFPYGYGNMRYITSLIAGCGIMAFGCGLSIYHGISGLLHPSDLEPLTYAYYALFTSFIFQAISASNAFRELKGKATKAGVTLKDYIKTGADPSLNVVLYEDTAAIAGVVVAFTAVSLSSLLNSPYPDACGSIIIGLLLGGVGFGIIRTNAAHLVGRSLPKRITDDIVCRLNNDPVIRSVHDVKATALGVEKSRFKAELDFDGRMITRNYLSHSVDLSTMLTKVKQIQTEEQLETFMEEHGEKIIDRLGDEIDRIENEITRKHPDIRHVDLEAL